MRKRLDETMVERGLAATRSRARDVIQRGLVTVAGRLVAKAGHLVDATAEIAVSDGSGLDYASRGALKLEAGLEAFGFDAASRIALDVGTSTGGFTDVLLRRKANKVYCVDVGHGQLQDRLASDPRVILFENTDARNLTREMILEPLEVVVADVSFISLKKVLPAALDLTASRAWLIALIKPQFEVGPKGVGKSGLVSDAALQSKAVEDICDWINGRPGWTVAGVIPSPIQGGSGNQEFLVGAQRHDV